MRSSGGVRRHCGYAVAAASTAEATSAALERGVCAIVSPVAGLVTSSHSEARDSTQRPLIKFGTLVIEGAATDIRSPQRLKPRSILVNSAAETAPLQGSRSGGETTLRDLRDCTLALANPLQRGFQHIERFIHLLVGNNEWHQHANHIGIRARSDRDQSVFVAIFSDLPGFVGSGFAGLGGFDEFDGLHATESAYIADDGPAILPFFSTLLKMVPDLVGTL